MNKKYDFELVDSKMTVAPNIGAESGSVPNVDKTEKLVDDYIGSTREKHSYKKRSKVFQNVKIFINTIENDTNPATSVKEITPDGNFS